MMIFLELSLFFGFDTFVQNSSTEIEGWRSNLSWRKFCSRRRAQPSSILSKQHILFLHTQSCPDYMSGRDCNCKIIQLASLSDELDLTSINNLKRERRSTILVHFCIFVFLYLCIFVFVYLCIWFPDIVWCEDEGIMGRRRSDGGWAVELAGF